MTPDAPTRRRLLAGGAAVLGTTVATQALGPASGAGRHDVHGEPLHRHDRPQRPAAALPEPARLRLSRGSFAQLPPAARRPGGSSSSCARPASRVGASPRRCRRGSPTWPSRRPPSGPGTRPGTKGGWEYAAGPGQLLDAAPGLLRAAGAARTMVDFWSNHLHVHADARPRLGPPQRLRRDHPRRTRSAASRTCWSPRRCTRRCCSTSTTGRSVKDAPNENQGRELLELHTVGPGARATPRRWSRTPPRSSPATPSTPSAPGDGFYDPNRHTTGPVQVLGFSSANATADGRAVTVAYLRYLAHHPATAHESPASWLPQVRLRPALHVAGRLPSPRRSATPAPTSRPPCARWSRTRTSCASARHAGAHARSRTSSPPAGCSAWPSRRRPAASSFARACIWVPRTALLYQWPRPDGPPYGDAPWASAHPDAVLVPHALGPRRRLVADHRTSPTATPASLAAASRRSGFDQYVDHLCRSLLGKPSRPAGSLAAASPATGVRRRARPWSPPTTRSPTGCSCGWWARCSTPPTT